VLGADRGTGKVGRWFADELPDGCRLWGVVRQQLLVHDAIPYTSHNSAAVAVIEIPGLEVVPELTERAIVHLENHWMEGSDPGLCVAWEGCPALPRLEAFGRRATVEVVTQPEAYTAAEGAHLSAHGGEEHGVIGAAAGVGLTFAGWNGRLIEYAVDGRLLRDFPDPVPVAELEAAGMLVVSTDRDAPVPLPEHLIVTHGWLRPRLWGGRPVVPVSRDGDGVWEAVASLKRGAIETSPADGDPPDPRGETESDPRGSTEPDPRGETV
jgi:hypothetical protein